MTERSEFSANLRRKRMLMGIEQKCLAEKTGVSKSTICRIEKGDKKPSFDLLVKLADALECSVDELIKGKRA